MFKIFLRKIRAFVVYTKVLFLLKKVRLTVKFKIILRVR